MPHFVVAQSSGNFKVSNSNMPQFFFRNKTSLFGFDMAKNVNIELSGDEFFMMSISKIMVKFAIVLVTHVKHLQ